MTTQVREPDNQRKNSRRTRKGGRTRGEEMHDEVEHERKDRNTLLKISQEDGARSAIARDCVT